MNDENSTAHHYVNHNGEMDAEDWVAEDALLDGEDGYDGASDEEEEIGRDEDDESSPYARIPGWNGRRKQGSQMRIRLCKAAYRMYLRTGVHFGIMCVNEMKNIFYGTSLKGGNIFQYMQLIAALETAKLEAPKKVQMETSVEQIMKAFHGTPEKKGNDYIVKVCQCLAEMDLEDDLLDKIQEKYRDTLARNPSFDVASATQKVLEQALQGIILNGFPGDDSDAAGTGDGFRVDDESGEEVEEMEVEEMEEEEDDDDDDGEDKQQRPRDALDDVLEEYNDLDQVDWSVLQLMGWKWKAPNNLANSAYMRPDLDNIKKKDLRLNEHYFESMDDILDRLSMRLQEKEDGIDDD
tara:strand:+ start:282 stop:1334 length:1053 start_codon:yes stop_codon:yes gene_type:complete